jgi:hypothetical protein
LRQPVSGDQHEAVARHLHGGALAALLLDRGPEPAVALQVQDGVALAVGAEVEPPGRVVGHQLPLRRPRQHGPQQPHGAPGAALAAAGHPAGGARLRGEPGRLERVAQRGEQAAALVLVDVGEPPAGEEGDQRVPQPVEVGPPRALGLAVPLVGALVEGRELVEGRRRPVLPAGVDGVVAGRDPLEAGLGGLAGAVERDPAGVAERQPVRAAGGPVAPLQHEGDGAGAGLPLGAEAGHALVPVERVALVGLGGDQVVDEPLGELLGGHRRPSRG